MYKKKKICYNFSMNLFRTKVCPRCATRVDKDFARCPKCELNYQKFEQATNKEAKSALKEGEKDRVLMRSGCPNDVKKINLLLYAILFGFAGAHLFYVGRKKQGLLYFIFFLIGCTNAILNMTLKVMPNGELFQLFYLLVFVWFAIVIMWVYDVVMIVFNKFKIPVGLKY